VVFGAECLYRGDVGRFARAEDRHGYFDGVVSGCAVAAAPLDSLERWLSGVIREMEWDSCDTGFARTEIKCGRMYFEIVRRARTVDLGDDTAR
jgi:hypothetical protein